MNASKHIRAILLSALVGTLAGCGGGGGGNVRDEPGGGTVVGPPETCPEGQVGTPPNCEEVLMCPAGQTGTPPNCTPGDDLDMRLRAAVDAAAEAAAEAMAALDAALAALDAIEDKQSADLPSYTQAVEQSSLAGAAWSAAVAASEAAAAAMATPDGVAEAEHQQLIAEAERANAEAANAEVMRLAALVVAAYDGPTGGDGSPGTCPSGQIGTPPNCTDAPRAGSTLEWMFAPAPPYSPDEAARAAVVNVLQVIDDGIPGRSSFNNVGEKDTQGTGRHHGSGICCNHYGARQTTYGEGAYTEWSYWAHADLSHVIPKVQRRPIPGGYVPIAVGGRGSDTRALFGLLDNGLFWIGDTHGTGENHGASAVVAGYEYANQWFNVSGGDHPEIFFVGATWRGDAFGIEKATRSPVVGPAELTISDIPYRVAGGGGVGVSWLFTARFKNEGTDTVRIKNTMDNYGRFNDSIVTEEDGFLEFQGALLGPQAEEAIGLFETFKYYGSFGLKKQAP